MIIRTILLALMLIASASLTDANPVRLDNIVDGVVAKHMADKQIPGMSVAIVYKGRLTFSGGYGKASVEFDVPASAATVYPISSVSKMFAGLLAVRLANAGQLDLDEPISSFVSNVPADKQSISVRHLLQHTHGLEDFYQSDSYEIETGRSVKESTTEELVSWSLEQPLQFSPGAGWAYSLSGYVLVAQILERIGGLSYAQLVERYVFEPLDMVGTFGGTESVVAGRNQALYELDGDDLVGHVVDFPEQVYAAAGLNLSVLEMAKLFVSLSGDEFIDREAKQELWENTELKTGDLANYGLGWFSYETSQRRWVVGHEGGGASWVIYYPDHDLAVIALSNMSGARADILPYEIAREAFAAGLIE